MTGLGFDICVKCEKRYMCPALSNVKLADDRVLKDLVIYATVESIKRFAGAPCVSNISEPEFLWANSKKWCNITYHKDFHDKFNKQFTEIKYNAGLSD